MKYTSLCIERKSNQPKYASNGKLSDFQGNVETFCKKYFTKSNSYFNKKFLSIFLTLIITLPVVMAQTNQEQYSLSGQVFSEGELADTTYVKVVPMQSVISESGNYLFEGISPGEHIVRAYFMNNGHSVIYRKMVFTDDVALDWHEGMNWITTKIFDENGEIISDTSMTEIELIETSESTSPDSGRAEFGPYDVNQYFTLKTRYGDIDNSTQYVHFKLERGSSASNQYPDLNDFEFHHGKNSKYGFIKDTEGNPISNVEVSNGDITYITNKDGFFLLQNLVVGSNQTITFRQSNVEILSPVVEFVDTGPGWLNKTTSTQVNLPHNVSFTTTVQSIPMSSVLIEWEGGEYTDFYSLYGGEVNEENLLYRGTSESFTYDPEESGVMNFNVVANNSNGSTINYNALRIFFLPQDSGESLWKAGMSWDYAVQFTPASQYLIHNVTITTLGSEVIKDAFGNEREVFLARYSDEYHEGEEKSYRWVDSQNLLNVHTYWSDDPSSSSYFQEGTLGWNFTNSNGVEVSLLSTKDEMNLHFNRTNIIGVPGHPNGYDDTYNTVIVEDNVTITTSAGTFITRHFIITDNSDGVISWELWYNESVRNWVKIIDKLSGSHSDRVVYELTGFDVPTSPQFITEGKNLTTNSYNISWAPYSTSSEYQLLENGIIIYQGPSTSFEIFEKEDGDFGYNLNAIMDGYIIPGDYLEMKISYIPEPPIILNYNEKVQYGNSANLSWNHREDIAYYSIIVQDSEGLVTEIYNGTENNSELEGLKEGQNRVRIKLVLQNGKTSELSPSIFIQVTENTNDKSLSSPISALSLIVIVLISSQLVYSVRIRKDD
tara:strand:+ start:11585 stop:14074 length:2490 start_codon:yes stop_codon:yes gene_type:complete